MILSPDILDTRSKVADWLELLALCSTRGAGDSDIASLVRLAGEDERLQAADDGEILEPEILGLEFEATISRVSEEIRYRNSCLGENYPFRITLEPFSIELQEAATLSLAAWCYLFLLLMTCQKDRLINGSPAVARKIESGRTLFHACASIGVAGVLRNATTIWFGWPRPDKSAFLSALANLDGRLGLNRAAKSVPAGLPSKPKDDGVDVIGWRQYPDGRTANLVIICQAATGNEWFSKSSSGYAESFKMWFDIKPYDKASISTAIPFPAHHEVEEDEARSFEQAVHGYLLRVEAHHGLVIDRLRIVEAVAEILRPGAETSTVGGIDKLPCIKNWVTDTVQLVSMGA